MAWLQGCGIAFLKPVRNANPAPAIVSIHLDDDLGVDYWQHVMKEHYLNFSGMAEKECPDCMLCLLCSIIKENKQHKKNNII